MRILLFLLVVFVISGCEAEQRQTESVSPPPQIGSPSGEPYVIGPKGKLPPNTQ